MTLYRPRDLIVLLNQAFFEASKRSSQRIGADDIAGGALEISCRRLDDLVSEYGDVIPGRTCLAA
jgi:hypothetical protein